LKGRQFERRRQGGGRGAFGVANRAGIPKKDAARAGAGLRCRGKNNGRRPFSTTTSLLQPAKPEDNDGGTRRSDTKGRHASWYIGNRRARPVGKPADSATCRYLHPTHHHPAARRKLRTLLYTCAPTPHRHLVHTTPYACMSRVTARGTLRHAHFPSRAWKRHSLVAGRVSCDVSSRRRTRGKQ